MINESGSVSKFDPYWYLEMCVHENLGVRVTCMQASSLISFAN